MGFGGKAWCGNLRLPGCNWGLGMGFGDLVGLVELLMVVVCCSSGVGDGSLPSGCLGGKVGDDMFDPC